MKKRIVELDIAKAISIAIIVFSHLTFSGQFQRDFVSLFDVPVFFILSGYFFKNTSFKESISKGIKRYLVPAYVFLLLDIVKDIFISNDFASFFNIEYFLKTIFFLGGAFRNYPLWFLVVLFCLIVIFNFIKNDKARLIVSALLIISNNFIKVPFNGYFWPICILYGFPFFCVGYLLRKKSVVLNKRKNIYDFLVSLIVLVIMTKLFGYNSMIEQIFTKSYILFFVAGLVGFYNIISLSNIIVNIPFRKYIISIGLHTKFILITHYYLCRGLVMKFLALIGLEIQKYNALFQLIATLIIIFMYVAFFELFDKYASSYVKQIVKKIGIL